MANGRPTRAQRKALLLLGEWDFRALATSSRTEVGILGVPVLHSVVAAKLVERGYAEWVGTRLPINRGQVRITDAGRTALDQPPTGDGEE
jgi:hypothetical protein